jgi:uncharacterized protein (DUF1778 family)
MTLQEADFCEDSMSSRNTSDARLNFRLPAEAKEVIEQAAAALGQSVNDYAVATLVKNARQVIDQRQITELTNRDRDRFLALLDDADVKPNQALRAAATKYKRSFGRQN